MNIENWKYELLEDNNFITIKFFPLKSMLSITWHKGLKNCTEKDFTNILAQVSDFVKNILPLRLFNNMRNFNLTHQNSKNFILLLKKLLINFPEFYKEVYVLPISDINNHMSIIRILDARQGESHFFLNVDDAMNWILS